MNFSFADVSNVFMDMAQTQLPKTGMVDGKTTESGKQAFSEKLNRTMEKNQNSSPQDASVRPISDKKGSQQTGSHQVNSDQGSTSKTPLNVGMTKQTGSDEVGSIARKFGIQNLSKEKGIQNIFAKLNQKKGTEFAAELKNIFLMLSEGELKNFSIDAGGLEALKKMLVKAGFKESDLDDLIAELSSDDETQSITMDKFFEKLFESLPQLSVDENMQAELTDEIFMAPSLLPFLQSILSSMGISQEKVQEILDLADKGEKGISLDTVIENLKSIQKAAFYSYEHYQTKDNDKNIAQMLSQLGLKTGGDNSSVFNLDDLVSSLEAVRKKTQDSMTQTSFSPQGADQKTSAGEKPLDLLTALFKGIKTEAKADKASPFEFSADQIKDEFKNNTVGLKVEKQSLKPQPQVGESLKDSAKEMASLFKEKENTVTQKTQPQLKETESLLKQTQTRGAKPAENTSVSVSDSKLTNTIQNLNNLKATAPLKNLPTYVTNQVTKGLVRAINQGENTLRLQLNPPELGRLMMTIDKSGDVMRVSIVTESLAAKEILTSNVTELKTVLSNSGVNLEKFEVDMNSDFRQSMSDTKNQAGSFSKRHQNQGKASSGIDNAEGINEAGGNLNRLDHDGSLHFVA